MLTSPSARSRTCAVCVVILACTACSKADRRYEDFAGGNAGDGSGNTANSAGAPANGGRSGGATGVVAGSGGVSFTSSMGGTTSTSATAGQGNIGGSSESQAGAAVLAAGGVPVSSTAGGTGGVTAAGGTITSAGTLATGGALASAGMAARGGSPATGGTLTTGGAVGTGGAATGGAATGGAGVGVGGAATGGAGPGPSVVFTVASVVNGATTNLTTATFGFGSSPSGATGYQCKLNLATAFTNCTSGLPLSQLSAGGQSLTVHAVNAQGIAGPDSTYSWTIVPLATTIKNIRTAGTLDDTLVTVSTNVRVTGFGTAASQQIVFVQEAGPTTSSVIDTPADLTGSLVLNAGILTRSVTTQPVKAAGTPVTVTGTVAKTGSNLELARASYIWGTGTVAPYAEPEVRTSTVFDSRLEGVRIALAGQIPQFNCSSSCFNSSIGNAAALCIETTCMDSGCAAAKIVSWLNIAGSSVAPVTSGYGIWRGWLVKRSAYYEFWTDGSDSYSNDLCL